MGRRLWHILGLLALASGLGLVPAAELDEVQSHLLQAHRLPLRWENVESSQQWLAGPAPTYRHGVGVHVVCLDPGTSVLVRVPPQAQVCAVNPHGALAPGDVEFWLSNGSGLAVRLPAVCGGDGRSLVVTPAGKDSLVARVTRPCHLATAVEVALFVSRTAPLGEIAPYRHLVCLDRPAVKVCRADEAGAAHFWPLAPGSPGGVELVGPVRLAVVTRLCYPPTETRTFQSYRITVSLGGRPHQLLDYAATVEDRHAVFLDGRAAVLGRPAVAYVEIPAGRHRVTLDATAPLCVRVLRQEPHDYLAPHLNQPRPSAEQVRAQSITQVLHLDPWELDRARAEGIVAAAPAHVAEKERLALRLVRDNRHREGGLLGAMLLDDLAAARPDYPRVEEAAEKLWGAHTFYRDLVPRAKPSGVPQEFGWFVARRLLDPGEQFRRPPAAPQHVEDVLSQLPGGLFVPVPAGEPAALAFPVPERFGPSALRMAAITGIPSSFSEFWVQFDQQPPFALRYSVAPDLPPEEFLPAAAELALAGLSGPATNVTRGGPFSRSRHPAPLRHAGHYELPLPPETKVVRVWQTEPGAGGLRVALQYRAGKQYHLSETEYLEMARRAGADESAARELANHRLPLERFLRSRDQQWRSAVAPALSSRPTPGPPLDASVPRRRAEQLERQGQWLAALETWSGLLHGGEAAERPQALAGRVSALLALGEQFLAERQLRGLYLHSPDEQVRAAAFAQLAELYTRAEDAEALTALYAGAVLRRPTPAVMRSLAEVLLADDEPELALLAALSLPADQQPLDTLLRAAHQMRWWQIYEHLLARLPDDEVRTFWQAQRALAQGQEPEALALFRRAGAAGQTWATSLEKGQMIRAALATPDLATRAQAVLDWERWQARHPGPHGWRDEPSLVADYLGAATIYTVARDLYARFYVAGPARPVRLQVQGPARLRLEVRPLHQGPAAPLQDWLYVRLPGQLRLVPITDNFPADGLKWVGEPHGTPGTKVLAELEVGPGLHPVVVAAANTDVLVRAYISRPDLPLGVLPPLTPDTVAAALAGASDFRSRGDFGSLKSFFSARLLATLGKPLTARLVARLALRAHAHGLQPVGVQSLAAAFDEIAFQEEDGLAPAERLLALARSGTSPERLGQWLTAVPASPELREAALLAQGKLEEALALPVGDGDAAVRRRMTLLLRLAEEKPEQRPRAQALGEALFAAHPRVPELQGLYGRLTRRSTWVPVTTVEGGAGLRQVEVREWRPESPELRTRKALLQPFAAAEQAVTGHERFLLALTLLRPTALVLDLTAEDVPPLPRLPLTAVYQLDEGPEHPVPLTPQAPRQAPLLVIPAGTHSVRVWLAGPVANQFLRVRAHELPPNLFAAAAALPAAAFAVFAGSPAARPERDLVRQRERTYHVATAGQPVRVRVEGPAWLRIDELREGMTLPRYQFVGAGRHTSELNPEPGQPEALFRVAQRVPSPEEPVVPPRHVPWEPEPVPPPFVDVRGKLAVLLKPVPDGHPLSGPRTLVSGGVQPLTHVRGPDDFSPPRGQEDGSWSVSAGFRKRRPFEEDATARRQALRQFGDSRHALAADLTGLSLDEFFELRATHRYYDEWRRTYFETGFLTRARERSGPTLGFEGHLRHDPFGVPWTFHLEGASYLQWPAGDVLGDAETEWSTFLGAAVSRYYEMTPRLGHTPSLAIFGRLLSMGENRYLPGRVDQDVFTEYKTTHHAGWKLADLLTFRPWLDTVWWGRLGVVSNENFRSVDHGVARVGWGQLLGDLQVDVSYRLIHFFADDDRDRGVTRHLVGCELLWESWRRCGDRVELGFRLEHDLGRDRTSLAFLLGWHFGNGRDYRDFRPEATDHLDLRRRRQAALLFDNGDWQPRWKQE